MDFSELNEDAGVGNNDMSAPARSHTHIPISREMKCLRLMADRVCAPFSITSHNSHLPRAARRDVNKAETANQIQGAWTRQTRGRHRGGSIRSKEDVAEMSTSQSLFLPPPAAAADTQSTSPRPKRSATATISMSKLPSPAAFSVR